jgi:hypothetical protein
VLVFIYFKEGIYSITYAVYVEIAHDLPQIISRSHGLKTLLSVVNIAGHKNEETSEMKVKMNKMAII